MPTTGSMRDPMEGVTNTHVTLPVRADQYDRLERDRIMPGRPRVTHKLSAGPFIFPGNWVVIGSFRYEEPPKVTYRITFALLED